MMGPAADGLKAVTRFRVVQRYARHALCAAHPETGRQHQIRVHLAAIGHPIVGDKIYGAGERYFMLMAGVGFDAAVVAKTSNGFKRRLGAWSYVLAGVPMAMRTKHQPIQMIVDGVAGQTLVYWMVIGNTRLYGGFREITHRAQIDDGALDVAWMRRGGVRHLLGDGVRLLRGTHDRSANVRYLQAKSIDIETPGIPVQVDGEPHGQTPMRFEAAPAALTVIVPTGLRTPLFTACAEPRAASFEGGRR